MAPVRYEVTDGIAYVTIDRPERKNALNEAVFERLSEIWTDFSEDSDAHVAIVRGAEGDFSTGFDLDEEIDSLTDMTNEEIRRQYVDESIGGLSRGHRITKPVVAAIEGWCLAGGLELALACDLRIASVDARLGCFNMHQGTPLGDGGSVRLPLIAGLGNAMELALTGKHVTAERAAEMDIVNRVAPEGRALRYAEKYAELMLEVPQSGIRGQKETIMETLAGGNLEKALQWEGVLAYSYEDTEAATELPSRFTRGESDDRERRLESLEEAFADLESAGN